MSSPPLLCELHYEPYDWQPHVLHFFKHVGENSKISAMCYLNQDVKLPNMLLEARSPTKGQLQGVGKVVCLSLQSRHLQLSKCCANDPIQYFLDQCFLFCFIFWKCVVLASALHSPWTIHIDLIFFPLVHFLQLILTTFSAHGIIASFSLNLSVTPFPSHLPAFACCLA